jgi:hypothetical protein
MRISIKQFLLTLFLACEAVSVSVFAGMPPEPLSCSEKSKVMLKPKISVSFTIARRRDCEGFGICDFNVTISGRWNGGSGTMQVDDFNSNIILLEVDKGKGITAEAYNKFFRSGTFIMEDDCPIPADMVKSLGLSGTKTLVAGNHKVIERNGLLQVSIPVK